MNSFRKLYANGVISDANHRQETESKPVTIQTADKANGVKAMKEGDGPGKPQAAASQESAGLTAPANRPKGCTWL